MLEYCSDTGCIHDGDRDICEMCKSATPEDVVMILESQSGWHLAEDAARGLRVECDGDLGHEAEQIRKQRDAALKFIADLEKEAKILPMGHENEQRGKSSYNWTMWFVRRFNEAVNGGRVGNVTE